MISPSSSLRADNIRVGIIGAGIGRQHLRGYLGARGAQVSAICDLDAARAGEMARESGIEARIFTDYRALIDSGCVDAISVCVPNFLHAGVAVAALEAGLHVLCEKPLAMNARQAQAITDAATKNERVCMVSHVLRFRDDVVALKSEIEGGKIGEIYYARAFARRISGIPKWGGWFTQQKLSGGGPLIDTGVHILDLAWWLCGCPRPLAASGVAYAKFGPQKTGLGSGGVANADGIFDVEDLAAGLIRFEGGLSLHFEATWAIHAAQDERFCHLHGTNGAVLWDDAPKIINRNGDLSALSAQGGDAWTRQMAHFIACIQNNQKPDPDASQGVTMMQILDALYQSAREETEIKI